MKYVDSCEILQYEGSDVAVIRLSERMEVLSSAVLNGGSGETDCLIIMEVPHDYSHDDPLGHITRVRKGLGLPENTVGFMTAAEVFYVFKTKETVYKEASAFAAVTAGLSNQVVAGEPLTNWEERHKISLERSRKLLAGTINIIGISPYPMTQAAKVNIIIAMTEAKTAAMNIMGYRETGTTSDAIAIVSPSGDDRKTYAGTGTALGIAMARSVRDCVVDALKARGDYPLAGTYSELLESKGISRGELISLLSQMSGINGTESMGEILDGLENNAVFVSLIQFAAVADELCEKGLLKCADRTVPGDAGRERTAEILAEDIAEAVSGQTGIYDSVRIHIHKPKAREDLGLFLNKALSGLAAGITALDNSAKVKERENR